MAVSLRKPEPDVEEAAAQSRAPSPGALSAWHYRLAVLRHHRAVFGFAAATLGSAAEAEDVTQDTFVRYWQRGAGVEHPRAWLLTVARRLCLDRLRAARRFVAPPDDGGEPADLRDPEWHYGQRELGAELERAVAGLPEPQRSLVVLFDVQGLSGAECAEIVGLSVNQVKVYLHRARRRLRRRLELAR